MFNGSTSNIPSGWAICNGSNGTPDLRNRFIVAAGSTYALGAKGGETTHKLTKKELPSNLFSSTETGYIVVGGQMYDWPGHKWGYKPGKYGGSSENGSVYHWKKDGKDYYFGGGETHGGDNDGYGGVTCTPINQWITSLDGSDQAHENRPPYYALYFIMKIK